MRPGIVLAGRVLATACSLAAGCGSPKVTRVETAPPVACEVSTDCEQVECVCGLCTDPCAALAGECSDGLACYGPGSLGHSAVCGDSNSSNGVCLKSCASAEHCGPGQQCLAGGCVVPSPGQEPVVVDRSEAQSTLVPAAGLGEPSVSFKPSEQWLPSRVELSEVDDATIAAGAGACRLEPPCADLAAALHQDVCLNVQAGCGLIHVNGGGSARHAWYEDFGGLPVALSYPPIASRDVSCEAVEVSCWSCGESGPLCERAPVPWPELPPTELPAGCSCEPEGSTQARISMECFCSVYECPELNQLLANDCPSLPDGFPGSSGEGRTIEYACGLVWFTDVEMSGEKYGFEPATGELRAAHSFSPAGPITAPCNTFGVHAGERTACGDLISTRDLELSSEYNPAATRSCGCAIPEGSPNFSEFACEAQPWFQQLVAASQSR